MNAKEKEIDEKVRASYQAALNREYEKAIALCCEAIDLNREDLIIWGYYRYLAYCLKEQQEKMAEKLLEEAKSQYLSKDFDHALTNCEKVLTINPRCCDAWNVKAVVLGKLGRHQEAIDSLDHAIEIDSTDCTAWCNLGNALRELNRLEDALTSYNLAIDLSGGDYYEAWYNRGLVLFDLGRFPDALDSYNQQFIVNWFSDSIPEDDYYYHWRLFDEWQGEVNPEWYDLDIEAKAKLFTEFDERITDSSDFYLTRGLH